eukprot:768737-Hanusia_phi.AAC.8
MGTSAEHDGQDSAGDRQHQGRSWHQLQMVIADSIEELDATFHESHNIAGAGMGRAFNEGRDW